MSNQSRLTADFQRNVLHIRLKGAVKKKEIEGIYTDIRFIVADLKPGFTVVTDLSDAHIGYLSGTATFYKIARYLKANNVGMIIRISPSPNIITKQLAHLSATIQGYSPVYVRTQEEAEELLNQQQAQGEGDLKTGTL